MGWWNDDYDYDALNYLEGRCMDSVYDCDKQCYPVYEDEDEGGED